MSHGGEKISDRAKHVSYRRHRSSNWRKTRTARMANPNCYGDRSCIVCLGSRDIHFRLKEQQYVWNIRLASWVFLSDIGISRSGIPPIALGNADLRNDFLSTVGCRRIQNGRRAAPDGFPAGNGARRCDLGLRRREAYVENRWDFKGW